MTEFPSLFISHGAPILAIEDGPARRFLTGLQGKLKTPSAIIIVSAHYDSRGQGVLVSEASKPETIHDFGGFPDALYKLTYPAPGDPILAKRVIETLQIKGFEARGQVDRGFDHGAWVPLSLMYPNADIPILQVSIDGTQTPLWHCRLGKALAHFRKQGILIIGSGSATHNLNEFFGARSGQDDKVPEWVSTFSEWLADRVEAKDTDSILRAVQMGPNGKRNHPTMDHIHPLFVALGAGGSSFDGLRLHKSMTYSVLAMDMYGFGDPSLLASIQDSEERPVKINESEYG